MRSGPAFQVAAILACTGALVGFVTARFLPRRFVSRTTVAFNAPVSSDHFAYASDRALSVSVLTPIVEQSAYYKSELDFTPLEDVIQRIKDSGSLRSVPVGNYGGFRVEFVDPDRYAALEMTRILAEEMARGAAAATHVVDPINAKPTGPGAGLCVFAGVAGGLAIGVFAGLLAGAFRPAGSRLH